MNIRSTNYFPDFSNLEYVEKANENMKNFNAKIVNSDIRIKLYKRTCMKLNAICPQSSV